MAPIHPMKPREFVPDEPRPPNPIPPEVPSGPDVPQPPDVSFESDSDSYTTINANGLIITDKPIGPSDFDGLASVSSSGSSDSKEPLNVFTISVPPIDKSTQTDKPKLQYLLLQFPLSLEDQRILELIGPTPHWFFNPEVNNQKPREPVAEPPPGCCDVFVQLLRVCGLFCYVACPPVPSMITRKIAFHPPEKGQTYRISVKADPQRVVKNISRCKTEDYQLIVRNFTNGQDYVHAEQEVEVFSVTTAHRNELVCIKCSPEAYSKNSAVADQVILFCQPNSSDLGGFLQPNSMNFVTYANVFETDFYAFDYSGYGYSSGTQGEKNVYADVRAVYQRIRETRPDKKIVIMGYSIGTTAAVDLAACQPDGLSGVILVAPFTSGLRLFSKKPDKQDTCWADSFTSFDKINNIEVPVLICHGNHDEVIPLAHGLALYDRLKKPVPPAVIHGANHQTILSGKYIQTFTRIASFLRNESLVSCRSTEAESQSSTSKHRSGQSE